MTAGSRAVIGFPGVTSNFTLSGGSYNAIYPRSNLLLDDLKRVARSSDALVTSTIIKGTCATAQSVGVMMLAATNMDINATVRLRLYSDTAWTTGILDTGAVTAWPASAIYDPDWFWHDGVTYSTKSFQIDIANTGNADGFIDIGMLEIATAVVVTYGFKAGAQVGRRLRTTVSETPGGRKIFGRRASPRTFTGTFTTTRTQTNALFKELWRLNDIDIPFIWLPHPDIPTTWGQNSMLCRLIDAGPSATYSSYVLDEVPFKLEQVL